MSGGFKKFLSQWSKSSRNVPGENVAKDYWATYVGNRIDIYANSKTYGFVFRFACLVGVCWLGFTSAVKAFAAKERDLPLAHRHNAVLPYTKITLIEKKFDIEEGMMLLTFKLPKETDITGHEMVSAVRFRVNKSMHVCRWLNPINAPDEKGVIRFAVKWNMAGSLKACLYVMEEGEHAYLGRWMREYQLEPNTYDTVGMILTKSAASVALQILNYTKSVGDSTTKFKILYACPERAPSAIDKLFKGFGQTDPQLKGRVDYKELTLGRRFSEIKDMMREGNFAGSISREMVEEFFPEPTTVQPDGSVKKNAMVVVGANPLMTRVSGGGWGIFNLTYVHSYYKGILKDLGWPKDQVFQGGSVTPIWRVQVGAGVGV